MRKIFFFLLLLTGLLVVSCREGVVEFPAEEETGSVYILSFPKGADIYMNQSWTGKSTPDSLVSLQPGTYSVKLKLVGFMDTTITVSVFQGRKNYYSINLRDY